jgi:hypothetical protein
VKNAASIAVREVESKLQRDETSVNNAMVVAYEGSPSLGKAESITHASLGTFEECCAKPMCAAEKLAKFPMSNPDLFKAVKEELLYVERSTATSLGF